MIAIFPLFEEQVYVLIKVNFEHLDSTSQPKKSFFRSSIIFMEEFLEIL